MIIANELSFADKPFILKHMTNSPFEIKHLKGNRKNDPLFSNTCLPPGGVGAHNSHGQAEC